MDTRKTARIGFIGAGGHSTESLYPNIPMIPEFELAAVCDLDLDRAQRTARSYGARPADEPTWDDHVRGICADKGWDFASVKRAK